jgi:hypothetical protein
MAEGKVTFGRQADKSNIDAAKIAKGKKPEARADVEGQYRSWKYVTCPYCWSVNEVVVDTNQWLGYYCWNCSEYFEA